jgi:hypothetical protein
VPWPCRQDGSSVYFSESFPAVITLTLGNPDEFNHNAPKSYPCRVCTNAVFSEAGQAQRHATGAAHRRNAVTLGSAASPQTPTRTLFADAASSFPVPSENTTDNGSLTSSSPLRDNMSHFYAHSPPIHADDNPPDIIDNRPFDEHDRPSSLKGLVELSRVQILWN